MTGLHAISLVFNIKSKSWHSFIKIERLYTDSAAAHGIPSSRYSLQSLWISWLLALQ